MRAADRRSYRMAMRARSRTGLQPIRWMEPAPPTGGLKSRFQRFRRHGGHDGSGRNLVSQRHGQAPRGRPQLRPGPVGIRAAGHCWLLQPDLWHRRDRQRPAPPPPALAPRRACGSPWPTARHESRARWRPATPGGSPPATSPPCRSARPCGSGSATRSPPAPAAAAMMHGQHPAGWTLTAPRHVLSSDENGNVAPAPGSGRNSVLPRR